MKTNSKKSLKKGFSLVEMLVVIAVIGVLTAIAIPMIGRINEQAQRAKDSRNAQAFATMYNAAKAGGAADQLSDDDIALAIASLRTGIAVSDDTTPDDPDDTVDFRIDINTVEAEAVETLCTLDEGVAIVTANIPTN